MKKLLLFMVFTSAILFGNYATAQTYCTTGLYSSGTSFGDQIDVFTIGSFTKNSSSSPGGTAGFADFTGDTIYLNQSSVYALSVTYGPLYNQGSAIWIDFNDDGDWADSGEHLWSSASYASSHTGNATISSTADTGFHRLRIRCNYNSTVSATQSCSGFTYGEAEDYTVYIGPPPPCPSPFFLTASAVTATTANVGWTSTGTSFNIEYGPTGFTPGTGSTATVTTTSTTLTGLTPNTGYDFYVRSDCSSSGNGLSSWSGPLMFTTGCVAFSVPFSEDFDSTPSGSTTNPSLPNCWSYGKTAHGGAGYVYNYANTTYANSGTNALYAYTSNNVTYGDTMAVISPEIEDMDSVYVQLEFAARARYSGTSYTEVIYVGTMSDPSDLSTIDVIYTINLAGQITYKDYLFTFDPASGYNGTDKYLVIIPSSTTTYDYLHIDDVSVSAIPPCPKPLYPTFSNVTSSTADVSWSSGGSKFVLEYGPCGFTQGTGMFDTVYTNSATLTGLGANSNYQVYIQNDCIGAGNGISAWTLSSCFKTECTALQTPFTENFDGTASGTSSNPSPPDCWKYSMTTNGGYGYGYTRNYATFANSGSQFFYMYHSNTTDTMGLVSPAIDSMDLNEKHIQFWARGAYSSTSYDEHIIVGTLSDPADMSTFSPVDTVSISGTTYKFFDVYLDAASAYNGTDMYIGLAFWTGTSTYGYACIDDINIADVPSCIPSTGLSVSNISANSADVSWVAGDGLAYNIEYGPTGFTQGTGPIATGITSTSYSLSGLMGNSCYDVYVRDSCAGGMSPWFGPITFCTACDPVNTPLLEDFENVAGSGNTTTPNEPDCWSYWRNPNATYYGYSYSALTPNGSYHWRFYQYNDQDTIALISPAINGISNGTKQIRFKNKSYYTSTSYSDGIAMEVGTTPNYNSVRGGTAVDTIYGDYGTAYVNDFTVRFDTNGSAYNGTDQFIYMRPLFQTGKWYGYNFVDDINIEDIPLCAAPWNLSASNITSGSADVSWSTVYGTAFQIEYGPTGFIPGTGNGTTISNAVPGATISGLAPNTYYDVYVADNCDSTEQSGPFTFKTECSTQLAGNYTIGGTGANFASLDSAVSLIAGCGVTAATTLTLQQSDTAAMSFGAIAGASASNTVTFKGSSASKTDTIFLPMGSTIGIELNGTAHLTFKDLTIMASSQNFLVWMHNNANHITFDNCDLVMPTSTSSLYAVVAASGSSTTASSTGDNANDITIKNCLVSGGYYGLTFYGGSTTSRNMNLTFENNTVVDYGYYGVRVYYFDGVNMEGNHIEGGNYAMYLYYLWNMDLIGNSAFANTYSVYCYRPNYLNTSTTNGRIENNFFGASNNYAWYGGYWENLDFIHNSFKGGIYGCYVYGQVADCEFRNNIFVGGSSYALYNSATSTNTTNTPVDFNLYYSETGSTIAYWAGSAYTTLTSWQSADTTMNAGSLQGDPGFISATDFHIVGTLPNDAADNNTSVNEDIDGDSRPATGSTTKDIGADEFTPLNWDASLTSIDVALGGCGDSATEVTVSVTNFGQMSVTALPITVMVSGGATATINYTTTDTIGTSETKTYMVGTFNAWAGASGVMFDGYTSLSGDQKTSNDTINGVGPGNYISYEPMYYAPDTVCANLDSASLAAVAQNGVMHGWYANMADTIPVGVGDTFQFPMSGQTTWYLGYLNNADSLETTFAAGNGQNGNIFDLDVKNSVAITGFTIANTTSGTAEVWYRAGSYVGYENSSAGWTNLTPTPATISTTSGPTYFALPTPLSLSGGNTYAFYVTMSSGSVGYTNGSSLGSVYASNADLDFKEGVGKSYPFGSTFSPRIWNGRIHYGSVGCSNTKKTLTLGVNTDTAVAIYSHNVNANGADVDFDATGSYGHLYEWTFGDGGVGTGMNPTHTYAAGGSYTACLKVTDTICGSVDSICYTVVATVGIDESLLNQSLSVFPNPTSGKFRVEFQVEGLRDVELRVVTLLGQIIYSSNPGKVSGSYREEIDLSKEATGVYVLQIVTDENVVSRRITMRK